MTTKNTSTARVLTENDTLSEYKSQRHSRSQMVLFQGRVTLIVLCKGHGWLAVHCVCVKIWAITVAPDRDRWLAVLNILKDHRVPKNAGNFLANLGTLDFLRWALLPTCTWLLSQLVCLFVGQLASLFSWLVSLVSWLGSLVGWLVDQFVSQKVGWFV